MADRHFEREKTIPNRAARSADSASGATRVRGAARDPRAPAFQAEDLKNETDPDEIVKNEVLSTLALYDRMEAYYKHLEEVGFYPHSGQLPILKHLFSPKFRTRKAFCQCSRNFGKTTLGAIFAVGKCAFALRQKVYIFSPFLTQTIELYYASGDLAQMIPPDFYPMRGNYGSCFLKNEYRWVLDTKSFIKLEGADEETRARGVKPHAIVCDEFQDWKKRVWDAMEPNLIPNKAPALILGTPPDVEGVYTEQADEVRTKMESGDKSYFYIKRTIYDNPRWTAEDIETRRLSLVSRGEEAIWKREYLAEFIPGGARAVYPQFGTHLLMPRNRMLEIVEEQKDQLVPYTIFDPSSTRFACSGFLYNPYLSKAYWMFAVAESETKHIVMGNLIPRIISLEEDFLHPYSLHRTYRVYDEAARLWAIEVDSSYGLDLIPTTKHLSEKNSVILLARDLMSKGNLMVMDNLENVVEEFFRYRYDDNGRIVKKKDDLMDTFHYFLAESGYQIAETPTPEKEPLPASRRPESEWTKGTSSYDFGGNGVTESVANLAYELLRLDDIGEFL